MLDIIASILTVFFIIDVVLLVVVILMQNKGEGMGLFASSNSQAAFGSSSGDILTKTTGILTIAFFVIGFALMYCKSSDFDKIDDVPEYREELAKEYDMQGNPIEIDGSKETDQTTDTSDETQEDTQSNQPTELDLKVQEIVEQYKAAETEEEKNAIVKNLPGVVMEKVMEELGIDLSGSNIQFNTRSMNDDIFSVQPKPEPQE